VEEKKMKKTKNNTKQIYQSGPQTLEFYMDKQSLQSTSVADNYGQVESDIL
jgi:heme-binding NEAT domain protein